MKRNNYVLVAAVFLAAVLGFVIGNLLASRSNRIATHVYGGFSAPKTRSAGSNVRQLNELFNLIDNQYVDTVNIEEISENMLYDLVDKLDPHSVYIPASDLESVNSELEGSFSGIGIQFNIQNDTVMVISVISGGPSEKAGILAGDRIVSVNDTAFTGKEINNEKVMKKLRGMLNSKVVLSIKRNGSAEILTFNITRDQIPVTSIDAVYMLTDKTGFIKINAFAMTTYNEFLNAIATLKNEGAQSFIIDLRENGGGLMEAAVAMVNEFLPAGRMIVYSDGKAYKHREYRSDGSGSCRGAKVAVLIDEFSASASEIFAGAIQDNDCGTIVGRRSFGKGLVQQQFDLSNGAAVRLTVARYYTPSGRSIQKPYTIGESGDYELDIYKRYTHGEFDTADSIQFADTVVYKTVGGRSMYGGGGIMPDVFVARDTAGITPYFTRVFNHSYLYQFAFRFTDQNRAALEKYRDWQAMERYLDARNLLPDFVEFAKTKGVNPNTREIEISKSLILRQIKSYIIRNTLGDNGFYPAFYKDDRTIRAALEIVKN